MRSNIATTTCHLSKNISGCFTRKLKNVYVKRKEAELLKYSYGLSEIGINEQIPTLNDRPIISSIINSANSGAQLDGILYNINNSAESKKRTRDGKTKTSTNSFENISPVKLLEDVFLALSVISLEFQDMTDDQVDMCMGQVMASVPGLFKESMLEHFEYIKRTFKINYITQVKKDSLQIARRRGGKTFITCAVTAAGLAVFPKEMDLFFSTGSRISLLGRATIIDMLEVLKNSSMTKKFSKIRYETSEESLTVWNYMGYTNRADFFPSNEEVCI